MRLDFRRPLISEENAAEPTLLQSSRAGLCQAQKTWPDTGGTPGKKVTARVRGLGRRGQCWCGKAAWKRPLWEGLGRAQAGNALSALPASASPGWKRRLLCPRPAASEGESHLPLLSRLPAAGWGSRRHKSFLVPVPRRLPAWRQGGNSASCKSASPLRAACPPSQWFTALTPARI